MIFNQYHCNARYRGETVHEVVKPYMDEWTNYGKIVERKRQQGDRVKGRISYFLKKKLDRKNEKEREKVRETKNRRERRWRRASEGDVGEQVREEVRGNRCALISQSHLQSNHCSKYSLP
jgi:hypothetical protein